MFSKVLQTLAMFGVVFGLVGGYYVSVPVPSGETPVLTDTAVPTLEPIPAEVAIVQTEAAETLDVLADPLEDEDDADEDDEMPVVTFDFGGDPLEIVGTPNATVVYGPRHAPVLATLQRPALLTTLPLDHRSGTYDHR